MLVKFAVKNFRGFPERLEWDLSHPSNYGFNSFAVRDGVVHNGIIYGKNGSGKTALSLAVFDIVNHLTQKHRLHGYYDHFASVGNSAAAVEFEYEFRLAGQTLRYAYSKTQGGRLSGERLEADGVMLFDRQGKSLFIDGAAFPMGEAARGALMQSDNQPSLVNFLLASYPLAADNCLIRLRNFVEGMLWLHHADAQHFIGLEGGAENPEEYIVRNGLTDAFRQFLLEVSGQEFRFAGTRSAERRELCPLLCEYGKERVAFSTIASAGTRALTLLFYWMQKMSRATLVFVDEFDAFYHYETGYEVCRRLFALDCQLFMTAHSTFLLTNDLLRPDCNFILHNSTIRALCDCTTKELRIGHNIEKIYRGGGFGGI